MLVSVIIPSYNHELYIAAAVESVLSQTYRNLELIVIDDGSKDKSVEILRGFKDPRMTLLVQENAGAHATINRGLSMASGDYLTILNSDDLYDPTRLEKCLKFMSMGDYDVVSTWIEIIDGANKTTGVKQGWRNLRPRWAQQTGSAGFWNLEDFNLNILSTNFVSTTSNILMRRRVIEELGGMRNLRFSHDWDFMLRAAALFSCGMLQEPLMKYRVHGSNTISSNEKWMLFETCWVLAANLHMFENGTLFPQKLSGNELVERVNATGTSIKIGKCERLYLVLRSFIEARRSIDGPDGIEAPLHNAELRAAFISLIDN